MDQRTRDYYQKSSREYRDKTFACNMAFLTKKFMDLLPPGASIVDLGCGPGRDMQIFCRAGFHCTGIDASSRLLELAQQNAGQGKWLEADIRRLPLESQSTDAVWACASFVHFTHKEFRQAMAEAVRILRPGGVLLISVKEGQGQYRDADNRLFTLFEEEQLREVAQSFFLEPIILEHNENSGQKWLTLLARKPAEDSHSTMLTIRAAMTWGKCILQDLPENSLPDVECLICETLSVERRVIYGNPQQLLTIEQQQKFFAMLNQRKQRIPLAYIIGKKNFMGLDFEVNSHVLVPRPETEILVEKTLELFSGKSVNILELGTGSGCIAISLAKYLPQSKVTVVDISQQALQVAKQNAEKNKVAERITFLCGDLFAPVPEQKFELLVSNPPYIAEQEFSSLSPEVQCEPKIALIIEDGLTFYRRILEQSPKYLRSNATLLLEIGYGQAKSISDLAALFQIKQIIRDYAGIERVMHLSLNDKPHNISRF